MAILNSHQLLLLDHYSNGAFRYLADMDAKDAMEKAKSIDSGDLLLPYLLAEMEDVDNVAVGINRIRSTGNQLMDLATDMEEACVDIVFSQLEQRDKEEKALAY